MAEVAVNLFWTGGWDSTFRLLDLVINQQRVVQPYYLVDARPSLRMELTRIGKIREAIQRLSVEAGARIRPSILVHNVDLPHNELRFQQFANLRSRFYLGGQYELLAGFADYLDATNLELGVHSEDKAALFLRDLLVPENGAYRLPQPISDDDLRLFERFSFPLLATNKRQMMEETDRFGWWEVMNLTWFCYTPTRAGHPCGVCNPCSYAIEEGMGWRIPARRRALRAVALPSRRGVKSARRLARRLRDQPGHVLIKPLRMLRAR